MLNSNLRLPDRSWEWMVKPHWDTEELVENGHFFPKNDLLFWSRSLWLWLIIFSMVADGEKISLPKMEVGWWEIAWVNPSCWGKYFQHTLPRRRQIRQSHDLYYLSIPPQKGLTFVTTYEHCPWLHEPSIFAVSHGLNFSWQQVFPHSHFSILMGVWRTAKWIKKFTNFRLLSRRRSHT